MNRSVDTASTSSAPQRSRQAAFRSSSRPVNVLAIRWLVLFAKLTTRGPAPLKSLKDTFSGFACGIPVLRQALLLFAFKFF